MLWCSCLALTRVTCEGTRVLVLEMGRFEDMTRCCVRLRVFPEGELSSLKERHDLSLFFLKDIKLY